MRVGAIGRKVQSKRDQLLQHTGEQLGHDDNTRKRPFIRVRLRDSQAAYEHGAKSADQKPPRAIHLQRRPFIIPRAIVEHILFQPVTTDRRETEMPGRRCACPPARSLSFCG
jgi:hypothetical protein